MTLYLLDANVIIRAHEDYYPVDRIPPFWTWLLAQATANVIKIPRVIFDEITPSAGPLADWVKDPHIRNTMILDEPLDGNSVRHGLARGYAPDLNDVEILEIGQDPFLVAAALAGPDRTVVTREISKPGKIRANRRLPDVCETFGVPAITDFRLYNILRFSIP